MLEQGWKAPIPPSDLFSSGFYLLHHSAQGRKGPWSTRAPRPLSHTHKHRRTAIWRGKSLPLSRKPLPEPWTEFQTWGWPRPGPDRLRTCQPQKAGVGPEGSGGGWNGCQGPAATQLCPEAEGWPRWPPTHSGSRTHVGQEGLESSEFLSGMEPLPVYSRTGKGPLLEALLDVRSGG